MSAKAQQVDLYPDLKPPRRKPRVMAHVADAGCEYIRFRCDRCGWDSDWVENDYSVSQARAGIPCERCNREER